MALDTGGAGTQARPVEDLPGWRARLEAQWRRTLDRVVELCQERWEGAPGGDPGIGGPGLDWPGRRVTRAHEELAEIEDALARIARGSYGRCERCRRPIRADLLARAPHARYCRGCQPAAGRVLPPPRSAAAPAPRGPVPGRAAAGMITGDGRDDPARGGRGQAA